MDDRRPREDAVLSAPDDTPLAELARLGGLDPRKDFRRRNFGNYAFANADLRGVDFTGSRLHGCDFTGARIAGARFDQARLGAVLHDPSRDPHLPAVHTRIANLRAAADWTQYRDGWTRAPGASQSDDHLPVGAIFQDAPFGPEMVVVPAGEFTMGSDDSDDENPPHRVAIEAPFAVGRFAVTFEEWDWAQGHPAWREHSGLDPREPDDEEWGRGRRPVIGVSWDDAQAYCRWLTAVTGKHYRLASEAEWEYCCRAGTTTAFSWGNSISTEQANYDGRYTHGGGSKGDYCEKTVPVDSFAPNPWGLYQMHGNVWEWCEDNWHPNYNSAPQDGSAWKGGDESLRVCRGGSWLNDPRFLRSADRSRGLPSFRGSDLGFRLARTL